MNTAHVVCEASPSCGKFQSAICLHCSRRLCLQHITEHTQIIHGSMKNLNDELEFTTKQINDDYEKSRDTYNDMLLVLNRWRTQQTEKIQQIYERSLQCVESQQETLNLLHQELTEELDRNVRQQLNNIECQQPSVLEKINNIHLTIKRVQQNSTKIKWNLSLLPPDINLEKQSVDCINVENRKRSATSNTDEISPKRGCKTNALSDEFINLRKFRSYKRLVDLFSNTSSVPETKLAIAKYLSLQDTRFQVPTIVSSYLTAWYRKAEVNEKDMILNKHLSIINEHIDSRHKGYIILLGLHAFFFNERIQGNKRDMMTFLLNFFVSHKCISQRQILNWYNNIMLHGYLGLDDAQLLIAPYIATLWNNNNNNTATSSTLPEQNIVEQSNTVEIKQEPQENIEIKQEPSVFT